MIAKIDPVPVRLPSFLGAPRCHELSSLDADVAVVAVPFTIPADLAHSRADCSYAPGAMREQSLRLAGRLNHYDFDVRGGLFAGRAVRIVDCGDVAMQPGRYDENNRIATAVIRTIMEAGAFPLVLGGDPAASIPSLRAYYGRGSLCVVRIGADLDWCDEVNGIRESQHSAMRRASELPWVTSMIQIGLRGIGSTRQREVEGAERWGTVVVPAEEVHEVGVRDVVGWIPPAEAYYVSLDLGGLDPGIAPGVEEPAFGGLTYFQVTNILRGVAASGRVVGMDVVGIVPSRDLADLTSTLGVRLSLNLLGALTRAGQLGSWPLDLTDGVTVPTPATVFTPAPGLATGRR